MSAPDVVYMVRPGEANEELRYSLRSLRNLPHGRVWIAGYCPSWVTDVEVIPVPPRPGAHQSVKANLRAACEHPEVSEQFAYFNDDFYVMAPVDDMPVMHRGSITAAMGDRMRSSYTRAMKATRDALMERGIVEPLCYELHAPTLVTKSGMLAALELCHYPMMQERSLYGNLQGIGGQPARNFKVYRGDYGWKSWPFLSTNDVSFNSNQVGEYIRATFTEPSPYEKEPPPVRQGTRHAPRTRRPVRYSASTIRRIQRAVA